MRIERLTMRNMRLFGDANQSLDFDNDRNITILLGNNGCGKSTILDTIAILLSPYVATFPGNAQKYFNDADIHVTDDNRLSDYLSASIIVKTENADLSVTRFRKGATSAPPSEVKEIKAYAERQKRQLVNGQIVSLPILAYYGTGRGQIKVPERKRDFQKVFAPWDCYNASLEASTDFKRFFAWYDMMEDEERRKKDQVRDFNYRLPQLQVVREAIETFVDRKYQNPHIDIHPLRFVMDEYVNGQRGRELRLEQFSDGYKMVIAMVADIASRMAEGNPQAENPLTTPGIILIDEIDLHLHPRWQRKILRKLHEVFPNVQFIVTTHSPIILLGVSDIAQVALLDGATVNSCPIDFSYYDISQILLSEIFGLKSVQAPVYDNDIAEQEDLLKRYGQLSDKEKQRLEYLDNKLKGLSYSNSLESMRMQKCIDAIADQLNISRHE